MLALTKLVEPRQWRVSRSPAAASSRFLYTSPYTQLLAFRIISSYYVARKAFRDPVRKSMQVSVPFVLRDNSSGKGLDTYYWEASLVSF